jgi:hypothetical protein
VASASPKAEPCGTNASLTQTGGTNRTGEVASNNVQGDTCTPTGGTAAPSNTTTGGVSSLGLATITTVTNAQAGHIGAVGGEGSGNLTNTASSTVNASGEADAHSGDVPLGATAGSAPASATGGITTNNISDASFVSVRIAGENEAPITVTTDNTNTVTDAALASATSGAAGGAAPAAVTETTAPVTTSNSTPAVTSVTPVTTPASAPATCTGLAADTKVSGSVEKTVSAPAADGQPIEIGIGQHATVTNLGSTTGSPLAAAATGDSAGNPGGATGVVPTGASGGAPTGATAEGLSAQNSIQNVALVDVAIGGNNYAPITVAVRTISTIVNNAVGVVETAMGGGAGAGTESSGLGARVTNTVNLDGAATVDIPGDNHSPISIVLHIAADLWNTGRALLGLDGGTGEPGAASARGLEVQNILSLLGRASVRIGGSNYAPIDIQIILENLIYNEGIAAGRSAAQAGAEAAAAARNVSSGSASCLSLLSLAGVFNDQNARVNMPVEDVGREVLAGNSHVVDVHGNGTARCSTGNVAGSGGNASSGAVTIGPSDTTLAVITTQVADASAKTEALPEDATPGETDGTGTGGNGSGGTGTGGTGGNGSGGTGTGGNGSGGTGAGGTGTGVTGTGVTHTAQVVVKVTKTPVKKVAAKPRARRAGVGQEDLYEWVVVWEPLYVIYPTKNVARPRPVKTIVDEMETETTTSMAGAYTRPAIEPTPTEPAPEGFALIEQIQLALLSLLGFLVLALLKRRLRAAAVRKAAVRAPELQVLEGGAEAAAE